MRLDLGVYGVLLAAGLGTAYWASLPATEGEDEKVSIYSIDPKAVAEVTFTSDVVKAVADRRDGDNRYWIEHTKTEAAKEEKKDDPAKTKDVPATPAPAAPVTPPKVTKERFLANDKMDELLKSLNPLNAVRVIGKVDDASLKDFFGEAGPKDKITVKGADGKVFGLFLGKKSYGSKNRFAMEEGEGGAKGRVVLIEDQGFENLERAPLRMYERKIVSFELSEVSKAEVKAGGKAKRLAHTQRDKNGELLWTDDEENAQQKPSYDSWMDKLGKLRLTEFATPADEAALKDVKPYLEVTFERDGKVQDTLVFKKAGGDTPVYWVYSDFLKTHAKVVQSRVEPIEKDIGAILSDAKS